MEKHEDLVGVLKSIYRWRKAIILTTLLGAALSIGISLMLPEYYKSTTTFYAASPDLNKPDRLFGDTEASYNFYGNDADIDRIRTLAESGNLVNFMVDSFELYSNYELDSTDEKSQFYVQETFRGAYDVTRTEYDAVQITIEDKSPELAASMSNAARNWIESASKKLIKESQFKQLNIYKSTILDQNRSIATLEAEISSVNKKYGNLSATSYSEGSTKYGNLQTRLEQLATDQSKLEDKYNKLNSAYDTDVPALHIIEEAKIPVIKSRPVRWLLVVTSTMAAFVFSLLGALLLDYYKEIDWNRITS